MEFFIAISVGGVDELSRDHVADVLQKALANSSAREALDDALFSALFPKNGGEELKISKFELSDVGGQNDES